MQFTRRFDDYLLDNYYREENFDVQAQDIIIEMALRKRNNDQTSK